MGGHRERGLSCAVLLMDAGPTMEPGSPRILGPGWGAGGGAGWGGWVVVGGAGALDGWGGKGGRGGAAPCTAAAPVGTSTVTYTRRAVSPANARGQKSGLGSPR